MLGNQDYLDALGTTRQQAESRLAGHIGGTDVAGWLARVRASLG